MIKSLHELKLPKLVSIDVETNGLNWTRNQLIGMGYYSLSDHGYIPINTEDSWKGLCQHLEQYRNHFFIGHNIKFDLHFLTFWMKDPMEFVLNNSFLDTADMIHLWDSRLPKSLEEAEKIFLGGSSKSRFLTKRSPIHSWDLERIAEYCINDCKVTWDLYHHLLPELKKLDLLDLFRKDMAYLKELFWIEHTGFLVDQVTLEESHKTFEQTLQHLEQLLFDQVGHSFNWRSHAQLSKVLYDEMNFPRPENPFVDENGVDRGRNPEHKRYNSTMVSQFILMEKAKHPLADLIGFMRECDKLMKTIDGWRELLTPQSRIHTSFNLTGTRTGRISSSNPNMQNIPSEFRGKFQTAVYSGSMERKAEFNLRRSFIADPGCKIVSIDYKQMEMRMFAILAQEEFMLNALNNNQDIHRMVAQKVWGVSDDIHREWAKQIAFGLIYGMTTGSLMFRLDMERDRAWQVTYDYWNAFPRVRPWLFQVVADCKEHGFLRYWSKRIWREEDPSKMYKGANALVQGGCADLISVAVIRVGNWLRQQSSKHRILNLIHDEILFEVPEEDLDRSVEMVSQIMRVEDLLGHPFFNDAKVGNSYGETQSWKKE